MNLSGVKSVVADVFKHTEAAVEALVNKLRAENENSDEEIRKSVSGILGELDSNKANFKRRIDDLESSGEFERFTIAFFGQTNAGKSTIIEALRILFDEAERRKKIGINLEEQKRYCEEYNARRVAVISRLEELKKMYKARPLTQRLLLPLAMLLIGFFCGIIFARGFM